MISVIIPVYNEEELVARLCAAVLQQLVTMGEEYELIVVDDGSTDHTLTRLLTLRQDEQRIKVVQLSRNFGHQPAFTAGLELARGEYVVMMDGDFQDPPELIPALHAKITSEKLDIVYAKRTARKEGALKVALSRAFHFLFRKVSNLPMEGSSGNFCIMNRQAVNALLSIKERHRYLPGLRFFVGFKQGFVEFVRPDRMEGRAKMNYGRLLSLAMDAIFSFTNLPIRICLVLGGFGIIFFLIGGVIVLVKKIIGVAIIGWTSILLSIYFLGSVQLFFLGILGEYVFRIHEETRRRPLYIIRKIYE